MSAEDKARLAVLEAENARLKADQAAFAEAEKKRTADARHADHAAFAEGLVKAGKLLPLHQGAAVAALDFMAGQDHVIEFGEGDARQPLVAGFKALLEANPKQVEFGEVAGAGASGAVGIIEFAAPSGYEVDSERLATLGRARAYAKEHNCNLEVALKAVSVN
jgi:hypothetical protein